MSRRRQEGSTENTHSLTLYPPEHIFNKDISSRTQMSPPDRAPKSLSILFSCAFPVSTSHLKTLTEKKKVRKKKNSYWEGRQKGRSEKRKQEGRGKGNEGGKEGGHIGSVLGAVQPTLSESLPRCIAWRQH